MWNKNIKYENTSKICLNIITINFIFFFGLIIFVFGFFPTDYNDINKATKNDIPSTIGTKRYIRKIYIIKFIIDI